MRSGPRLPLRAKNKKLSNRPELVLLPLLVRLGAGGLGVGGARSLRAGIGRDSQPGRPDACATG